MTYGKISKSVFLAGVRAGMVLGRRFIVTLISKLIQANGVYRAVDDGASGYSVVTVSVPEPTMQSLTVTQNGIYNPASGVDGFNSVTVNVSGGGPDPLFALTDYIESNGTQYIDTLYSVKSNTKLEIVCTVSPIAAQVNLYPMVFGVCDVLRYQDSYFCWKDSDNRGYYSWSNNNGETRDVFIATKSLYNDKTIVTATKEGIRLLGNTFPNAAGAANPYAGAPASQSTLYLFALNQGGAPLNTTPIVMKLYRCRIYEGDTLVMDLLPTKDGNNRPCLYDSVSQTYFYSATGTDFTFGTDT